MDTLKTAMEVALARQQFHADGEASYLDTLRSNAVFGGAEVKAYVMARVPGARSDGTRAWPKVQPLNPARPIVPVQD